MALIKCEECENDVSDKASVCPKCGAPISLSEVAVGRASFYQSKRNEESFPILFAQILIVAAALGIFQKSWLYFGGAVIGLLALFSIPRISRILGALLAGGFGIIGYYFGSSWWGSEGGYVLGGFVFFMCFWGNYFGADHIGDFNAK
jgi:hypothetical protein